MLRRTLKYVIFGLIAWGLVLPGLPAFARDRDDRDDRHGNRGGHHGHDDDRDDDRDDDDRHDHDRDGGALFVMTNSTDPLRGNEIAMYRRDRNGDLSLVGYFPTGQLGSEAAQRGSGPAPTAQIFRLATNGVLPLVSAQFDGLGSSNSLILSKDNRCLFAVNGGDNSVSSFRVRRHGLHLASVVPSKGILPVSLTEHRDILYVLNAGETGTLAGFRVRSDCDLEFLYGSRRSLSGLSETFPIPAPGEVLTSPAQAAFTPDGRRLVLSIKGLQGADFDANGNLLALPNGLIVVFPVEHYGRLGEPTITPFSFSEGTGGPFSFVFDDSRTLIIVHANSGTVASFTINDDNRLSLTHNASPLVINDFAPCWIVKAGEFIYTASFGAPSGVLEIVGAGSGLPDLNGAINGFQLRGNGTLRALGVRVEYPDPSAALGLPPGSATGNHAIDMHVIDNYLYFIQPRTGMVGRLTIRRNGALTDLQNFGGLAPGLEPFPGLNPGINDFLERCFISNTAPECALGSAQGITGF